MFEKESSCYIIVGHYGSGKTEVADNLAIHFTDRGKEVVIADLDIVNPYFRTRECQNSLDQRGVRVISSNFSDSPYEDTPGLSPEITSCFLREDRINIIDVGGDPVGARVLGRYRKYLQHHYEMWIVINRNRYYTGTTLATLEYYRDIEAASGLKITGIINNTNSCEETTAEDLEYGDEMASELSRITGSPIVGCTYVKSLDNAISASAVKGERFSMQLMHRPGWMQYR